MRHRHRGWFHRGLYERQILSFAARAKRGLYAGHYVDLHSGDDYVPWLAAADGKICAGTCWRKSAEEFCA